MRDAGHGAIFDKCIAPLAAEIVFSKTGDRQVMGSVNDHVQRAQIYLERPDASPHTVSLKLNGTPMGALDYRYPREALAKQAGMSEPATGGGGKVIPFPRKS
jgi:hypothetical protein